MKKQVVIVEATRTAIGSARGAFASSNMSAVDLGATVIRELVARTPGLGYEQVQKVLMGIILRHGNGQNPARIAGIKAGLPLDTFEGITVNKVCGSGLVSIAIGKMIIETGQADIVIAGGMENMPLTPMMKLKTHAGAKQFEGGDINTLFSPDGLCDHEGTLMGKCAEKVAAQFNISREMADAYALQSYTRAWRAQKEGFFSKEIHPIEVHQVTGPPITLRQDEFIGKEKPDIDRISGARPAFTENGVVTAANSSKISIGAAAVLLMSASMARKMRLKPLAKIIAWDSAGIAPLEHVLLAPIHSIPKTLRRAGMEMPDIELHEINEAFAVSTIICINELGLDRYLVNVFGGAVALGHPIGASGARVLVTLLNALKHHDKSVGMATLCLGEAEAISMVVKLI